LETTGVEEEEVGGRMEKEHEEEGESAICKEVTENWSLRMRAGRHGDAFG